MKNVKNNRHRISGILPAAVLLATVLLLAALPMTSLADKGAASGALSKLATPSNAAAIGTEILQEEELLKALPEKIATPSNALRITAEDLAGTWTIDGVTTYQFDADGKGSLILPEHSYAFTFSLEGDELKLQFEDSRIGTAVFLPELNGGRLVLEREEEAGTAEFVLRKIEAEP